MNIRLCCKNIAFIFYFLLYVHSLSEHENTGLLSLSFRFSKNGFEHDGHGVCSISPGMLNEHLGYLLQPQKVLPFQIRLTTSPSLHDKHLKLAVTGSMYLH
jgi:hypothetical protein